MVSINWGGSLYSSSHDRQQLLLWHMTTNVAKMGSMGTGRLHPCDYTFATTPLRLHPCDYTPATTPLRLHHCDYTPVTTPLRLQWLHPCDYTPATKPLWLHSCDYTPVTTPLQLHPLWLHHCGQAYVPLIMDRLSSFAQCGWIMCTNMLQEGRQKKEGGRRNEDDRRRCSKGGRRMNKNNVSFWGTPRHWFHRFWIDLGLHLEEFSKF